MSGYDNQAVYFFVDGSLTMVNYFTSIVVMDRAGQSRIVKKATQAELEYVITISTKVRVEVVLFDAVRNYFE